DIFYDEPDDSLFKEIFSRQTFTLFKILEKSLKLYVSQIGFKIRIVKFEKENDT
ncbi:15224_t:CDS:1, partial [Funneliformis caledonium]